MSDEFPHDFIWGVAAAAPQIEGAADADGKGESIWDRFSRRPGAIVNGDGPAIACDHYHRYADDFALMQSLGVRHYRLSIAWPRIFPNGDGAINERGLDFYDKLIDAMLARGITPWVTLYHWDLPQALEDRGGWRVRATAEAFGAYAATVVRRLGDRVRYWMTLNELPSFVGIGYGRGRHAPGATEPAAVLNQCYHHALLAHGLGVRAVRGHARRDAWVGLVDNPSTPVPATETSDDIAAAREAYFADTAQILAPACGAGYPAAWLDRQGCRRAAHRAGRPRAHRVAGGLPRPQHLQRHVRSPRRRRPRRAPADAGRLSAREPAVAQQCAAVDLLVDPPCRRGVRRAARVHRGERLLAGR